MEHTIYVQDSFFQCEFNGDVCFVIGLPYLAIISGMLIWSISYMLGFRTGTGNTRGGFPKRVTRGTGTVVDFGTTAAYRRTRTAVSRVFTG